MTETSSPEQVVQAQLDAYNSHDIDAFMATYAPDLKLYTHPDRLMASGAEQVREQYGRLFANTPNLNARVAKRTVQGRFVIDQEIVTGLPNGGEMSAVAIYEVRDGLIQNVWFIH